MHVDMFVSTTHVPLGLERAQDRPQAPRASKGCYKRSKVDPMDMFQNMDGFIWDVPCLTNDWF
eukprot:7009143-Karenia_brevis.AAC.1